MTEHASPETATRAACASRSRAARATSIPIHTPRPVSSSYRRLQFMLLLPACRVMAEPLPSYT